VIQVGRLAPIGQWDQNILDRLFANQFYDTGLQFKRVEGYPTKVDGCVMIIPGRYWFERTNEISEALSRFQWVLAIRTGDEEDLLEPDRVFHRNIKWWVQSPKPGHDYGDARLFGVGFPAHFNDLNASPKPRPTSVFLSAQNTHGRRHDCFQALQNLDVNKVVNETAGFTQGLNRDEYTDLMCAAKIAPAPSGPVTADSFRLFEALEAHTIPIADDKDFWLTVFHDAPFPIVDTYDQLAGYINDQLDLWPANANKITAWWMHQKRQLSTWITDDLHDLGAT
jgi:hypothetical protein